MADLEASSSEITHKKNSGVKKAKKLSTRVDMTPMVDLGFLLITFFIFTTTMSTPNTMTLNMPKKVKDSMKIKESNALTIILGRQSKDSRPVYFYMGRLKEDGSNFKTATFNEIRKIIIDKRKEVMNNYLQEPNDSVCIQIMEQAKKDGDPQWEFACQDKNFVVVIKPTKDARYANIIDLLDEMTINGVKSFALIDILPQENILVETIERTNGLR